MAIIPTPTDWMNFADWDRYWSEVLADKFWKRVSMETWAFEHTSLQYLQHLVQRQGHRILLAGNGISPEPYGFAHAGCAVTVVDVSGVACQFLRSLEITPGLLGRMFTAYDKTVIPGHIPERTPNPEKSLALVAEEGSPGGSLSVVTANLFAYEPNQPFHAIFSRRAYQGLPPDRREELAQRFFRWLLPGGLAFVETLNIRDRAPFEAPFRAAGFQEAENWSEENSTERRVLFWHGSG